MPARQPRPTRSQDPEYLAELGGVLLAMTDTQRREFLAGLDRDNLEVAERALAARIAVSWRATPATMAHYLEPESFELYDYWRLLGELFAGAFRGTDEPHQQWWVASQYGKAVEVGTPIPTPAGWRTMGDLAVGDEVIGGNGQPCRVSFVSEVQWGECWRLDFHDGGSLVADADHQWKVWDKFAHDPVTWRESRSTKGAWRVVTTADLVAAKPNRYRLPSQPAITLPDADLPLDPYVLGIWLGDGSRGLAVVTTPDSEELNEYLADEGWRLKKLSSPYGYAVVGDRRGQFVGLLRELGVLNDKHVPDTYIWAGDKQRLALLQGLMDSDGGMSRNPSGYTTCEFTSTNERLAAAVEHLARSLGIRAKTATGRATLYGKDCGPKWRVTFTADLPVFRLSRKARLLYDIPGPRRGQGRVGIKRIERAPSVPCRCIQVESPDGTYLAGRAMTVTHNTSLMANWGPVWALDMNPRLRLMYVSYDADKAVEEVGKARDIAERHYGHLRFRLRPDKRARGMWSTPQGGGLYAVGINGAIVGYPADGMLLDDLLKGWVEAHSPATRNRVWSIYRSQIRMRMQSETCPILCAGTRWHMDDVQARLLQLEEAEPAADHWKVTRLATVAEAPNPASSDPILRLPDPLGREVGQVLEPRRFSEREVATRFATLGSYLAGSLEQQRPSPEEGGEIKRGWFKIAAQLPDHADDWLSSTDPKLKDKESGDFVVVQVWARTGKDYWLVDQLRGQWSQAMTINAICLLSVRHPQVRRHVIENTGNGPEVMETLRTAMPDYVISEEMRSELGMTTEEAAAVEAVRHRGLGGLIPNTPRGSKSVRMRAVSPLIEAGDVHLPDPTRVTWVAGLLDELAAFGSGSGHDDQCFPAGTLVLRPDGPTPIEQVKAGDAVLGSTGWVEVLAAGQTGIQPVVDRGWLAATTDHPVWTEHGWQAFASVGHDDKVTVCDALLNAATERRRQRGCVCAATSANGGLPASRHQSPRSNGNAASRDASAQGDLSGPCAACTTTAGSLLATPAPVNRSRGSTPRRDPSGSRRSSSTGSSSGATPTPASYRTAATSSPAVSTSSAASRLSTRKSGKRTTARFLQVITFITRTAIGATTGSRISIASRHPSMLPSTPRPERNGAEAPSNSLTWPGSESKPPRGTAHPKGTLGMWNTPARSVKPIGPRPTARMVTPTTRRTLVGHLRGIDSAELVTENRNCSDITEPVPVFNLTTTDGTYFADGILVHNCDALSQALSRLSHGTASVASPASAPLPTGGPSVRTGARFGVIPGARVR